MCNELFIFSTYELNGGIHFALNYESVPSGLIGTSLTQDSYIIPLINDVDNLEIGKIQFVNTTEYVLTNPPQYYMVEYITIRLNNNNTSIYATNYFISDYQHYPTGDKIIIPIISCTGDFVGKTGYIVIDARENIRNVTIRIDF
jgi:hypothetical protein